MPKENTASLKLNNIRRQAREHTARKPQYTPSEVYLSVLGNGSKGTPRCLCVFTDHKRYIFNCGEGTQRLAHEHKARLSKVHHIFFTHKSWRNIGGLPGLSLTMQDIGIPDLLLHGPPDIDKLYPMTKHFLMIKHLQIKFRPHTEGLFQDNCFQIWPVALTSSASLKKEDEGSSLPDSKKPRLSSECSDIGGGVAVAYICKLIPKPGQLLLEKCVDLGVPCGPLLGELKNGKDITLENGTVVKASDVVSPAEPPLSFIVLECPSESFLDSLLSNETFKPYQTADSSTTAIVHFTPLSVVKLEKYQQWIARFPSEVSHLYLSSEEILPSFIGVHRLQCQLNKLDSSIFPALAKPAEIPLSATSHYLPAECSSRFLLRPTTGYDRSSVVDLSYDAYEKELLQIGDFSSSLSSLHQELEAMSHCTEKCSDYPKIVFLGTGSSIPSKVRNVSSILVEISPSSCILLDCGEGTHGQLIRLLGISETEATLCRMKTVFISHLHADHHMGLLEVLMRREDALKNAGLPVEPVNLVAPTFMQDFLTGYNKVFEPVMHLVRLFYCNLLEFAEPSIPANEYHDLLNTAELKQLSTVFVRHCRNAYGVVLTTNLGTKIVYSGDTMPCDRLVLAGKGCDLLIHEATMEDDLKKEAEYKTHSTTTQAINIGTRMEAKFTVLTHFSQRYAKVPLVNQSFHSAVGFAFDNMKIGFSDLPKLPKLIPVLKCMFHDDYEEMEERSARRKFEEEIILRETGLSG